LGLPQLVERAETVVRALAAGRRRLLGQSDDPAPSDPRFRRQSAPPLTIAGDLPYGVDGRTSKALFGDSVAYTPEAA